MKKRLEDLTLCDIKEAIWEVVIEDSVGEGSTEDLISCAILTNQTSLPDSENSLRDYIVHGIFELADGTTLDGFISPRPGTKPVSLFATIFYNEKQVGLGCFNNRERGKMILAELGKEAIEFFPLKIKSSVAWDEIYLELELKYFP